jgi:ribonuclease R
VHIADVSHYVPADGAIDLEARARGTSVYLPGQVLPMLPEKLSNGLCSLRPQEIRLTKTVRMKFAADGSLRGAEIFPSFIRSVRRFNYGEVQAVLDGGRLPEGEEPLAALLRTMNELAELLRQDRRARGMLEMDIPEAHILTDEKGSTTGVELRRADASHRLIEQFMLAANEAVANHLLKHKLPYIARAHDEPEEKAIAEFRDTARALGHALPSPGTRQQIQRFLARAAGKPEAPVLNYLLLRSMKIAQYVAEDQPHYAIAAPHYLHFTSPIRRYPDLLAHRILQESWSGRLRDPERRAWWTQNLPVWAARSTETERTADEAERAITTRRLLEFVAQRKEPMTALITAAENYGLRVQVCDYLLDGVVRMSSLSDGFYRVNRERGSLTGPGRREYKVGQTISVRVLRYDPFKHQIEFQVQNQK